MAFYSLRPLRRINPLTCAMLLAGAITLGGCSSAGDNFTPETGPGTTGLNPCSGSSCVDFQFLDEPVIGLNYECGAVRNLTDGSGFGQCPDNSIATFYLTDEAATRRITLGRQLIQRKRATFSSSADQFADSDPARRADNLIFITPMDLGNRVADSDDLVVLPGEATTEAVNITRLLQTLRATPYVDGEPVNQIDLRSNPAIKAAITELPADIVATDFASDTVFTKLAPMLTKLGRTAVDDQTARMRMENTLRMLLSGFYSADPRTALPVTDPANPVTDLNNDLQTTGVTGRAVANPNMDKANLGIYVLVDRAGNAIGHGVQFKGPVIQTGSGQGATANQNTLFSLFRNNSFQKLAMVSTTQPFDIYRQTVTRPLLMRTVRDDGTPAGELFELHQGRLLRNTAVVGNAVSLRNFMQLPPSQQVDESNLGRWRLFNTSADNPAGLNPTYVGAATLLKVQMADTYLDPVVWRTINTVRSGERYTFPLHVKLTFLFRDGSSACAQNGCMLGTQAVSILPSGDIITDMNENCQAVNNLLSDGVSQEYRVGFVRTTLQLNGDKFISPVMLFAGNQFGKLDGLQIGTVGFDLSPRIRMNISGAENPAPGNRPTVNLTANNAANSTALATYGNLYKVFQSLNSPQPNESQADYESRVQTLIAQVQGNVTAQTSACYNPAIKP